MIFNVYSCGPGGGEGGILSGDGVSLSSKIYT